MLYSKKYIGLIALILFIYSISIDAKLVNSDGSYETVPLEKDTVTLAVIQTGINSLQDFDDPKVGLRQNLDHMIDMGEKACAQNPKPDFLLFHAGQTAFIEVDGPHHLSIPKQKEDARLSRVRAEGFMVFRFQLPPKSDLTVLWAQERIKEVINYLGRAA